MFEFVSNLFIATEKMERKKFGIFTPYSIILYSETNSDNPGNFLKRNAILFEKLVIAPFGIGPLDGTGIFTKVAYLNKYSKEIIKYKKDFSKILLSIDDFVDSEESRGNFYNPQDPETSMWTGECSKEYIQFVMDYVQKKNNYDKPGIQSREHKKELEYYIGTISMDFQILTEALIKFTDFSGLFSEIHEQAFIATYKKDICATNEKKIINSIETINHFDFGILSWDEIIILRKSGFANDFRDKIFEWTEDYKNGTNNTAVEEKIDKFIDDSKFDFIEKRKPNLIKSLLTGILGNISVPTIINPISLHSSLEQIINDKKTNKEFGWLLFIQKARKLQQINKPLFNQHLI